MSRRKIKITPNGIDAQRFVRCLEEKREDDDMINIGAVLRIAPIKDVKTMIRAFAYAKRGTKTCVMDHGTIG